MIDTVVCRPLKTVIGVLLAGVRLVLKGADMVQFAGGEGMKPGYLLLGIYQLGASPTWINPASPRWPKGGKAEACRAAQIADVQGSRRTVQGRRKAEAHQATKPKTEGGN